MVWPVEVNILSIWLIEWVGGMSLIAPPLLIFLSSSSEEERTKEGARKLCTGLHLSQLIVRKFYILPMVEDENRSMGAWGLSLHFV